MLSVKKRGIKYDFVSFWYNSIWDRTQVPQGLFYSIYDLFSRETELYQEFAIRFHA